MSTTTTASNINAPTQLLKAGDETYAYRRFGHGVGRPLLCLQHFTGTLDNWDPAVTDPLASGRELILFDSAGVGRSTSEVPPTVAGMATHGLAFLDGLGLTSCDVLGFSLGGMVAQQMAQERPSVFRRMILVGTAPRGGEDIMHLEKPSLAGFLQDPKLRGYGPEVGADWRSLKSPETYIGHQKAENFASPSGAKLNAPHVYAVPVRLRLNHWALSGEWTLKTEAAVLNATGGRTAYRFHARDLHLIMGPFARRGAVPFRVLVDGQPPSAGHGSDVDAQGNGTVTEQRLYQLIRQSGPIAERQFEIEFLDSGVEAFAFAFG